MSSERYVYFDCSLCTGLDSIPKLKVVAEKDNFERITGLFSPRAGDISNKMIFVKKVDMNYGK
jgi:hypothetical protein